MNDVNLAGLNIFKNLASTTQTKKCVSQREQAIYVTFIGIQFVGAVGMNLAAPNNFFKNSLPKRENRKKYVNKRQTNDLDNFYRKHEIKASGRNLTAPNNFLNTCFRNTKKINVCSNDEISFQKLFFNFFFKFMRIQINLLVSYDAFRFFTLQT